jgi:hypothetical protein
MASGDVCVPGAAGWIGGSGRALVGVGPMTVGTCAFWECREECSFRRRVKLQVQLHVPIVWESVTETFRPPTKGPEPKSGDQKHKHSVP